MDFTVLIVAPWYPAGPLRYLSEAFELAGCNVVRIGPTYFDHMGFDWGKDIELPAIGWELNREEKQWDLNEFIDWITKNYQAPDLLIISEENYQTDIIPTNKIPSILWSFDGWPNNFERIEMIKPTIGYINHPFGIRIHPRLEEDPRWRFMPGAAAPWGHRYLGLTRDYDFALLATMYGKRPRICEDLVNNGLLVWSGQATTPTYVDAYNRSVATYNNCNGQQEIKWRFWEAAAMGCINISGYTMLFDRLGIKPWIHYIPIIEHKDENCYYEPWGDSDEIYERIEWIKSSKDEMITISENARKHTLENHTYLNRIRTMLTDLSYVDNRRLVEKIDDVIDKWQHEFIG
jgi:hypothetical protein